MLANLSARSSVWGMGDRRCRKAKRVWGGHPYPTHCHL